MSVGIMPDWLTRPKTKIIASKKNNKSNHGGYAQTHSHTHTGTHYRPTDAFKHIYSYRRRTTKLLADLYLLVELSLNVMEVWRFRLITVLSTSQLLQPVSCQREWMWRSQDGLEVRPPSRYFPPPLHFKLGFLYSYFNGFILFFFSLTYIWLWAWWKAAVGGFSSLLSFRWKECGISSDLIPCQIKIHFSQQLSANVNKWTTVRFGVAAAETTTATTKYKREQEQRVYSCFKLTLIF